MNKGTSAALATEFMANHGVTMAVCMEDEFNDRRPSMLFAVVPNGATPTFTTRGATLVKNAEGHRPLLEVMFGNVDESARMTIYNPDGSIAFAVDDNNIPTDEDINATVNTRWAGAPECGFMENVSAMSLSVTRLMGAAATFAAEHHSDPQEAFNEMLKAACETTHHAGATN